MRQWLLGKALLGQGQGGAVGYGKRPAPVGVLTGATWATDASGRGYNTPTVGSELLTNPTFSSWSGDNPTSWTVSTEDANNYATQDANGMRLVADGSVNLTVSQNIASGNHAWFAVAYDLYSVAAGALRTQCLNVSDNSLINYAADASRTFRATSATPTVRLIRVNGGATDIVVRGASAKVIAAATLLAYVASASTSATPAAKIHNVVDGTQVGVIGWLDDPATPANFVIAIRNGTGFVNLTKCVAGVYTNLISVATNFVANAPIEIRRPSGNTFQLWYNNAQIGSDQTINDAAIANNLFPYYGAFSTHSGNKFGKFTLDGAEYSFPA